jgi:citrate lyase gamma subunit
MTQHELQRLLPRHYQILELYLAGHGPKEIAQVVEMTPQAITLITKSPLFQSEASRRRANIEAKTDEQLANVPAIAKQVLENASLEAAMVHVENMGSTDPRVRHASAEAILTRAVGDKKDQSAGPSIQINVESLQILQLALEESNKFRQKPVVITPSLEVPPNA